jgi:hypothetical protein
MEPSETLINWIESAEGVSTSIYIHIASHCTDHRPCGGVLVDDFMRGWLCEKRGHFFSALGYLDVWLGTSNTDPEPDPEEAASYLLDQIETADTRMMKEMLNMAIPLVVDGPTQWKNAENGWRALRASALSNQELYFWLHPHLKR